MKRKVIVGLSLVCVVVFLSISAIIMRKEKADLPEQLSQQTLSNDVNIIVDDIETKLVSDLLSSATAPEDKYYALENAALSKVSFNKIDQAIDYYRAVAQIEGLSELYKDEANINILGLAQKHNKPELAEEYTAILGDKATQEPSPGSSQEVL